jgi:cobalt-zinc-cadmium efflux system outer membrane protein
MARSLLLLLAFAALAGCVAPVRQQADALICERASQPVDLLPPRGPEGQLPPPQELPGTKPTAQERLRVPPGLPGSQVPAIKLPPELTPQSLEQAARQYFPPLPELGPEPAPAPGPEGQPLTLADLQRLARAHSPLLRQAASDVESARGAVLQAGLYPNPTFGTATQTSGPGGGPFYGVVAGQTIKTMGKLKLAQAAATMDLATAQFAYRRAETDLMGQVRAGYFNVLVAQESMRANRALVHLTDEMYRVMVQQFRGGIEVALYEPMQLGALSAQARAGLVTARNNYQLSWKQLASAMGLPGMAPTQLSGRADMPIPRFEYATVLAHVLASHTDVQTAGATIDRARYHLRLAQVTAIPDVDVQASVQQDASPPGPNRLFTGVQMTVPVPVFDRNQGHIQQAQGSLLHASEEPHRVRADLTARVAEAFRRYDESRALLELYRTEILPKQVQAFRSAVKRHYGVEQEKVSYFDIVQSEQNLVAFVGSYLNILGAQWQAIADLGSLLQTDDLFQLAEGTYPANCPALDQLLALPCCHPCVPVPQSQGVDGSWIDSRATLGLEDRSGGIRLLPPQPPLATGGP